MDTETTMDGEEPPQNELTADERDAYAELADRVRNADAREVWDAFGEQMYVLATHGDRAEQSRFAGLVLNVNPERMDGGLDGAVWPTYRQYGTDRTIRENAVAEAADAYAVITVNADDRVETARDAVVDALEREL